MVKNAGIRAVLSALALLAAIPVCAQSAGDGSRKNAVHTGGETSFASGWAQLAGTGFWYTQANTGLTVTAAASSTVKAYFDADVSVMSLPETAETSAGYLGTATLNRAYIKARLPWFSGSRMRLSAGKMPLAWGYGLYFNAGDLIFGADPLNPPQRSDTLLRFTSVTSKAENNAALMETGGATQFAAAAGLSDTALSSSALSELRVVTDWMCVVQLPFGNAVTAELAALPPVDAALNSPSGRFGGRLLFQPYLGWLESFEAGYLARGDFEKQTAYLAFDGTAWFDYNLCSSAAVTPDGFSEQDWNVSAALFRSFTIRTANADHALTVRGELLWYPRNRTWNAFAFTSYGISTSLSLAASYIYSGSSASTHYGALVLTWLPVQSFELSMQGLFCTGANDAAAITASVKYSY